MEKNTKFLACAIGIFVCYFYYGVLQEKITRGSYGEDENKEKFTCMLALVFFQCVVNYVFAKIVLVTVMKQGEDNTRSLYYSSSALTYLLAMVCSNMALQWVNYPTQVVGKSGKPIPVMILGVLLGKKNYPLRKFISCHPYFNMSVITFPGCNGERELKMNTGIKLCNELPSQMRRLGRMLHFKKELRFFLSQHTFYSTVVLQAAYSPHLVPCDVLLFPEIKNHL